MSKIAPKKKTKAEKTEEVKTKSFFEKAASKEWRNFFAKTAVVLIIIISVNRFIAYCNIESNVSELIVNLLLFGGLLSAYLHGQHDWKRNAKWFTAFVVVLIVFGGLNRLERQRKPEDGPHVVQKLYNGIVNHFVNPKPANACIRPTANWQTVFEKEYIGIGYTGGDGNDGGILTAEIGKDMFPGYKYIVSGKNFEIWKGKWIKYSHQYSSINKASKKGNLAIRAPQGEEVTVEVQRLK